MKQLILLVILRQLKASDIEVFTPDNTQYTKLSALCITAAERSAFSFQVSAKHNAHVALMSTDDTTDSLYEILIGGWENSLSCIRLGMQQPCLESYTGPVLNGTTYIPFWVSWINGTISLGQSDIVNNNVLMEFSHSTPFPVNFLAVMTGFGSTGNWKFINDTDCRFEEINNTYIVRNDTRCNGVTNYACASGYILTSGSLSRLCAIGQQWIGDPPVCSAIPLCPEILSTSSVTVLNQNLLLGGILSMTCAQHHALVVGNLIRTCLSDGTWDGVEPICKAIPCPEILSTSSVIVLSQNIQIGGILLMTCAKHHALVVGNLLRTCLPNATWDGMEPVCEGCLFPSAAVGYQFNSTEELITRMEEMTKELKVEREKTNAFIRSKISVKDSRTSSTGIGFVLGWGIIGSLLVAICLCDAASLLRHIRHGV